MPNKRQRFEEIEVEISDPNFWNQNEKAQKVSRERASLVLLFEQTDKIKNSIDDLETLIALYEEAPEKELVDEFFLKIKEVQNLVTDIELSKMLSGEGEENPSSKRVITFLAFILLATGFIAELLFEKKVNPTTFDTMMYIVLGGLGFTASEKFTKKDKE